MLSNAQPCRWAIRAVYRLGLGRTLPLNWPFARYRDFSFRCSSAPETIQTDNGAEFQSTFHYHVLDRGVGHVYIRPATPRLNGKVERSHRIDADEFYALLEGVVIDDTGLFRERLREWEDYYNCNRPHGALGGQTPYERLRQKAGAAV